MSNRVKSKSKPALAAAVSTLAMSLGISPANASAPGDPGDITGPNQSMSAQQKSEQFKSNQFKSQQYKSEQLKSEQLKSQQLKSEQLKSEQMKSSQPTTPQ